MLWNDYLSKIKNNKFLIIIILLLFLFFGMVFYYLFFKSKSIVGKELIIKQKEIVNNVDYQVDHDLYDERMYDFIHEGLTVYNYNDNINIYEPQKFVSSYEAIKQDGDIIVGYKFILKPNIKFHNGKYLKPSDIVFTFKRGLEKKPNDSVLSKLNIDKISKTCDNNNNTIEIYYKDDIDTSNMFLELSRIYILNQEAFEENNIQNQNMGYKIGLGYFYLKEFKENDNDDVVLVRFNDFYDKTIQNNFEKIIFKKIEDETMAIQSLNNTADNTILLDMNNMNIQPQQLNDKIKKIPIHNYSLRFFMLNCNTTKENVRKLIAQSLDMDKILSELEIKSEDYSIPKSFIYHSEFLGYEENPKFSLRDSQEESSLTKQKVASLNSEDKILKILRPNYSGVTKRIIEKIILALKNIGFQVEDEVSPDFNLMIKKCSKPDSKHNICFFANSFDNFDISSDIRYYFYVSDLNSEDTNKISFFQDDEFKKLIENIDKIDRNHSKKERLKKIGQILNQKIPVFPINVDKMGVNIMLMNKNIQGIKTHCNFINFKNAFIT
ncbi:ABC transporter substrate-binding protein [Candidatus Phytoplasma prunorum]|uniref:ABC transporter substrate-binding protein n=1 Tax=Candidatus Phytoplasma prunorum TaxID=47565 RepID=UPI002FF03DCA